MEISYPSCFIGSTAIQDIPVQCANVDKGCEWEGTVGTLKEHLTKCRSTGNSLRLSGGKTLHYSMVRPVESL